MSEAESVKCTHHKYTVLPDMVWFLCICMISWILHTFWLVLIYGLLEDRDKDDATSNKILLFYDIKQLCSVQWQITGDVKMYWEQQWYNCLGLMCHSFVLTRFWGHLWSVTRHLYSCSIIVKYPYQSCCYLKQLMSCFFFPPKWVVFQVQFYF